MVLAQKHTIAHLEDAFAKAAGRVGVPRNEFVDAEVLETSVVIIGGGAAGLAAARTLAQQDVWCCKAQLKAVLACSLAGLCCFLAVALLHIITDSL
eukprot:6243662-Amphidinium_carterae.1